MMEVEVFDVIYSEAALPERLYQSRFFEWSQQAVLGARLAKDSCTVKCCTKKLEIREQQEVPVRFTAQESWTVFIEELKVSGLSTGYAVWAVHSVGNGLYEIGEFKSLGLARDRAEKYVTIVCHGGWYDYDWRTEKWNLSASGRALGKPEDAMEKKE